MEFPRRTFLSGLLGAAFIAGLKGPALASQVCNKPASALLSQDDFDAIVKALNSVQEALQKAGLLNMPAEAAAFYKQMIEHYQTRGLINLDGDQTPRQDVFYDELDEAYIFFEEALKESRYYEFCRSAFNRKAEEAHKCRFDEAWKIDAFDRARRLYPSGSTTQTLSNMNEDDLRTILMGHVNYVYFIANVFPGFAQEIKLPKSVTLQLQLLDNKRSTLEEARENCETDPPMVAPGKTPGSEDQSKAVPIASLAPPTRG